MGYRSDVILVLSKTGVENLKKAFARADLDEDARKEVKDLLQKPDKHLRDDDDGSELWFWSSIKWYPDYPEVAFIENFIYQKAEHEDFRFMRIGENYEDITVEGGFWDEPFDLCMERSMEFDQSIPDTEFNLA